MKSIGEQLGLECGSVTALAMNDHRHILMTSPGGSAYYMQQSALAALQNQFKFVAFWSELYVHMCNIYIFI